ncbi:MAG: Omp28 family outer membrane lipoprotein [Muribaculaceae bacterium]|nr:Omp28 family outer membrane lipoprotein [Muribaculaceae bacterium]
MRIKSSLLAAAAAAIVTLASCESTPADERLIVDGSSFEPQRTVLIEDFTGQTCVNCPGAHELLSEFEGLLNSPDHVGIIAVGIHIPTFGRPAPTGLVAVEADAYSVGVDNAPSARINRRSFNGETVLNTDKWTGAVMNEIKRKAQIAFTDLTAELTPDGKHVNIHGKVLAQETANSARLQLWLVEDDVVKPQMLPNGADAKYVHHSVFRAAINGVNGSKIEIKEKKETPFEQLNYPLAEYVNPANLRIVAFVYTDNDGVLNAAHTKIQN